jgi:hypothetical protein
MQENDIDTLETTNLTFSNKMVVNDEKKNARFVIYMPTKMKDILERQASEELISVSALIRQILNKHLKAKYNEYN